RDTCSVMPLTYSALTGLRLGSWSSAALFFFSFYAPRHPRDLHSFPTRRSSDLRRTGQSGHRGCSRGRPPRRRRSRSSRRAGCRRSEEHTSELQSRFDLVCRLLLEKKKKTAITARPYAPSRPGSAWKGHDGGECS